MYITHMTAVNPKIGLTTLGVGLALKGGINYTMGHSSWYAGQSSIVDEVQADVHRAAPGV